MGHEFSGTIAELGSGVSGFSVGDRVAVYPFESCGECPNCRRGDLHVCQQAATSGLGLGANPGGYAESVAVRDSMLVPIPDELSLEDGALVEPLAVALHGINVGEANRRDRCVVIGAGPIGVMTAFALRARGIEDTLIVEKNEHRQERMRRSGSMRSGSTMSTSGSSSPLAATFPTACSNAPGTRLHPSSRSSSCALEASIVLLGVLEEPVEISQLVLLIKEAQMRASFAYRRDEFEEAVELLAARKLPTERLITGTAPLEDAQKMFDLLEDPATEQIKILLAPQID